MEVLMPVYMVERDLPGIEMDQLAAAQKAAIQTSDQFSADGKPVRYSYHGKRAGVWRA